MYIYIYIYIYIYRERERERERERWEESFVSDTGLFQNSYFYTKLEIEPLVYHHKRFS